MARRGSGVATAPSPSIPRAKSGGHGSSSSSHGISYKFKVLMLGDSSVGKSSIMEKLMKGDAAELVKQSTMGFDLGTKLLTSHGKVSRLQIWDTAGQERFRSIAVSYYRGAQGVMMCYDVCSRSSFDNVRVWLRNISEHTEPCAMMLLGNKADLDDRREVTKKMGQDLAKDLGMSFFETSAVTGQNIEAAFAELTEQMQAKAGIVDGVAPGEGAGAAGSSKVALGAEAGAEESPCAC